MTRRQIWVSEEFHSYLKELAKKEKKSLRLRKTPSTVDITHKLMFQIKEDKKQRRPFRAELFR